MNEANWHVVWVQTLNGAREVVSEPMQHGDAVVVALDMQAKGLAGFGGVFVVEQDDPHPSGNAPTLSVS